MKRESLRNHPEGHGQTVQALLRWMGIKRGIGMIGMMKAQGKQNPRAIQI